MSLKKIAFVLILSLVLGYSISLSAKVEDKSSETAIENKEESDGKSIVVETAGRTKKNVVIEIKIDGTINPATVDYIKDGIDYALKNSAQALLILIDTPGGLLTSTQDIVKLILNSPVPVIVYVYPSGSSATSAGVFITLSGHVAAMAEGTSIGAAHPVSLGGGGGDKPEPADKEEIDDEENDEDGKTKKKKKVKSQDEIMGQKIENYTIAFIESIAEKRKRNAEWAIEAVKESASITSTVALEKGVIDYISPNPTKLLETIDGLPMEVPNGTEILATKGAVIQSLEMNLKQKLINVLSEPNIAFLLLSLGSLGLMMEIFKPGMIFPGVAGAICFLTGCVSLQILPFNYAGLALLLFSIALFVAEIYVTSYGLLAMAGLVSFVLGGILLFSTPDLDVGVGLDVVLSAGITIGAFFIFIAYFILKAQKLAPMTGSEALIGKHGEAVTDISKSGKVFVFGEYWDAVSEEDIHKEDKIEVVELIEGMKMRVKKYLA